MKNILVTGGCGFIGSNFINYILRKDFDVFIVNIDCLNYCVSETNVINNIRYKFEKGNITDQAFVSHLLEKYHIDIIIHFAAQSHVDNSFHNSLQYTIDNTYGTHVLMECSRLYGKITQFIHISTDEVTGTLDIHHQGCTEECLLNPTNPYAASKAGAEFICKSYYHSFKLPVTIVRCNNVYGVNQYPEKLIPKFITLLKENKKLTIHGKGDTRRSFIWTEDVNNALSIVMERGIVGEIYNIGTKQEYSVMDVASILVQKIHNSKNLEDYIEYVEDRPFNDFRYALDTSKLNALGWKEEYTNFDTNLDIIIASINSNK